MRTYNRYFIPKWYYYATPIFILLDYLAGINIRVSALDAMPLYKYAYYGFCILCGLCIYIFPRYSPAVALFESAINYVLMILLLLRPYIHFLMQEDIMGQGWQNEESLSPEHITNLALAAVVAAYAFRASIHKLQADFAPTKQIPKHPPHSNAD
ncbi:MAG: hypothetical protein ACYSU5_24150 [Planctomycetota bacterium]|jgi:hypothetical protein